MTATSRPPSQAVDASVACHQDVSGPRQIAPATVVAPSHGHAARLRALGGSAGNRAVSLAVQRAVIAAERDWLKGLLTSRDSAKIHAEVGGGAAVQRHSLDPENADET